MGKPCRLWSTVVYAELNKARTFYWEGDYFLEGEPYRLEDLRIKMRSCISRKQGSILETIFSLEVLALLENRPGSSQFFSRNEDVKDRLPWTELRGDLNEIGLDLISDIKSITWDADLKDSTLKVKLAICYLVLATRKQAVDIARAESSIEKAIGKDKDEEALYALRKEIIKAEAEKLELKRKIHCFEKDIQSLKKGISKAESRNLALNEELSSQQQIICKLKTQAEKRGSDEKRSPPSPRAFQKQRWGYSPGKEAIEEVSTGGIIKRIFQNNS